MTKLDGWFRLYRKIGWDDEWLVDSLMSRLFFLYMLPRCDWKTGLVKMTHRQAASALVCP